MVCQLKLQNRRKERLRTKLRKVNNGRLRLTVYRSNSNMYAQIIDDVQAITVVSASTKDKELMTKVKSAGNVAAAHAVGELIAKRAVKAGVKSVYFDRSGYLYHGRVKAVADAARENGLSF